MELEMKFKVDGDYSTKVEELGFVKGKRKHQIDMYFLVADVIEGKETWLRLREDKLQNTFSCDLHCLNTKISAEETEICLNSVEDLNNMQKVFNILGYSQKCVVDKQRQTYIKDNVEIVLDKVEGLGAFLEVEIIGDETQENFDKLKSVASQLGFTEAQHLGDYPSLFYKS